MNLRIGIAGCGAIAEAMHIPAALAVDGVAVTALVDTSLSRAQEMGRSFGVQQVATALADVAADLDAVIVCTPPHLHLSIAEEAFRLGLHVLCEKPMANSVAECQAMVRAAKAAGRVLAMAHLFRFYPSREAVRGVLARGEFGRLRSVTMEQGTPYSWQTVSGFSMRRELVPGGVLIDAGIHPLDTLLWWCGDPARLHYEDDALGGLESNVRLRAEFPNDVVGSLRLSRTCSLANEIRVECERGTLVLSPFSVSQYEVRTREGTQVRNACSESFHAYDPARRQVADFVEAITQVRPPHVPGEEGIRSIRVIEECYQMKRSRPLPKKAPIPGLTW